MLSNEMALGAYDIDLAPMCSDHIPQLHELSLAVRWPHRATDWKALMMMGEGFVGLDSVERLVCSMMYFPMSDDFASIGMGISSPRLQSLGAGRWLAQHIQDQVQDRHIHLFATKDSLPLCLQFGFDIVHPVFHLNGVVSSRACAPHFPEVKTLHQSDYQAIEQLDSQAMGVHRHRIIHHLLHLSKGRVLYQGDQIRAFALYRSFGRGYVIGPIVAEDEAQAIELIAPILSELSGHFVRVDTYLSGGAFVDYLNSVNVTLHETATKMARGILPKPVSRATMIALASQATG
ncbi:GNAT family N-acetyltransferase [Vibrio cholerae]